MILFIVSEVMFFFAFFWAFFTSSLAAVFNIGGVRPPSGIEAISPWGPPEDNKTLVFKSGNPQGLIASMPEGGRTPPMLNTGAKEEVKNAQKYAKKNIT